MARKSSAVVVPGVYLKRLVVNWGISNHCVSVVYNAVSFAQTGPTDKPAGELWLVSAGRLVPWKGMRTLLELMPALREKYNNLKLKIYGRGPEEEKLREKADGLGLREAVEIAGQLPRGELARRIKAAYIFILNRGYGGL